jgi:nitroreductase
MDAYLAVVSKRELRSYDARPISAAARRRVFEAGRVTGSSKNRQARRLVVLSDPALVQRAAACVYAPDNVLGAALVVAIVVGLKGPTSFDAGRAAQNMMLAASNDGIGSCPNGIADAAALQEIVGHDDSETVATVLTFGYPVTPRDPSRLSAQEWIDRADRKPYEDVVEER